MPNLESVQGAVTAQYGSGQTVDYNKQIQALMQQMRNMQWWGAPPIEVANVQARIDDLRRQQAIAHATAQRNLAQSSARETQAQNQAMQSRGIGGARPQSTGSNAQRMDNQIMSDYLSSLFQINSGNW